MTGPSMTHAELLAKLRGSTVVNLPTAGLAFDMSRMTAYKRAAAGDFPVRVIRTGRKIVVPSAEILKALGIPTESKSDDSPELADSGAAAA